MSNFWPTRIAIQSKLPVIMSHPIYNSVWVKFYSPGSFLHQQVPLLPNQLLHPTDHGNSDALHSLRPPTWHGQAPAWHQWLQHHSKVPLPWATTLWHGYNTPRDIWTHCYHLLLHFLQCVPTSKPPSLSTVKSKCYYYLGIAIPFTGSPLLIPYGTTTTHHTIHTSNRLPIHLLLCSILWSYTLKDWWSQKYSKV